MSSRLERARVLITVMTYPHPSKKHTELVCTAGVTERGEWVRLYPIDYRYRPAYQRFHKYQWIDVALSPHGAGNDRRKESRRPDLRSIVLVGDPLSTSDDWAARREVIDPLTHHTLAELEALYKAERVSLGIVRPKRVIDIEVRAADPAWKPEWRGILQQGNLFEGAPRQLRKLPYSFHYVFECDDELRARRAMIEDWELGVLFLKEVERLGSDAEAAASVRHKYLTQMCAHDRDVRFFVGTRMPYNTWLVLGVFWPPKTHQHRLF
jgi:hypothetical protein